MFSVQPRALAQLGNAREVQEWSDQEKVRFVNEIGWCVDALAELSLRIKGGAASNPDLNRAARKKRTACSAYVLKDVWRQFPEGVAVDLAVLVGT
jgi:hypothetical protein